MPKLALQILTLVRALENDLYLGEVLFYPEVSRLAEQPIRLRRTLTANARFIVDQVSTALLSRRHLYGEPTVREFSLRVEVPADTALWTKPLHLKFHAVCWSVDGEAEIAYIPALEIEVVAPGVAELEARLESEVRAALTRRRILGNLHRLVHLQRTRSLEVQEQTFAATVPTPLEAQRERDREESETSVLGAVATDLTQAQLAEGYETDAVGDRIAAALSAPAPQSVLLVGPSGVGKTAAFNEFVRLRAARDFAHTPFWATSGSRLVAGVSGFGMWQERCEKLRREARSSHAIVHLGNLVELQQTGKSEMIREGVAAYLRPHIERGEILAVVECTPEQISVIEREDPHLLSVFQQIRVEEPSEQQARRILEKSAAEIAPERIGSRGIETLDRLHRRFATYSAYPGRPLRFLRNLLLDHRQAGPVTPVEVMRAFSRETGLPQIMIDDSIPMRMAETASWFGERIIGQEEAVELVVDLLAMVKSGLARPHKPLASFLFIGPTGVGKTETAKALAQFLFNDRTRMTRFDMSEFSDPASVERLIGGSTSGEGLLTSRVRERPFSVILFDEFEKAHPLFFDLLLQVLGEGRLTDTAGRLADFTNCVIIMTSNLGARTWMEGNLGIGGLHDPRAGAAEHFQKELRDFIRPELLNRIDRVVPFLPLDRESILRIVKRELELVRRRHGVVFSGLELNLSAEVAPWLARSAAHSQYGARPLKRAIEQKLLAPLADELNRRPSRNALRADVTVSDGELRINVASRVDRAGRVLPRAAGDSAYTPVAHACTALRRKIQTALACPAVMELRNEIYSIERRVETARRRAAKRPSAWMEPELSAQEKRLPGLRAVVAHFTGLSASLHRIETDALLGCYGTPTVAIADCREQLAGAAGAWDEALLALLLLPYPDPDLVTLCLYGQAGRVLFRLAEAYVGCAETAGDRATVYWYTNHLPQDEFQSLRRRAAHNPELAPAVAEIAARQSARRPARIPIADVEGFFATVPDEPCAIGITIAGSAALPRYESEAGLHEFRVEDETQPQLVLVDAWPGRGSEYEPHPPGGEPSGADSRRRYDLRTRIATEADGSSFAWTGRLLGLALEGAMDQHFSARLEGQVGL